MSGKDSETSLEELKGAEAAAEESLSMAAPVDLQLPASAFPLSAVESEPESEAETETEAESADPEIAPGLDKQEAGPAGNSSNSSLPDYNDDDSDGEGSVMSVVDHLDELRTRLIRSLLVLSLAIAVSFVFGRDIIRFLEEPAKGMHFQALSIEEPVLVYFKVSFYAALVIACPYLVFEIFSFVSPGLKRKERNVILPVILLGPLLFLSGGFFCYYLVLPPMFAFFNSFSGPIAPVQQRLDFYISLVTTMIFYMGICFQLPIVLFALSLAGIVNSRMLLSLWRYALLTSSVVAAVITPDPTVISMLIVMAALSGLYFFTVLLLRAFGR